MRRIFGFILIFISGMVLQQHIHADSKDIVVMEEDTPYSMQTMFSSGTGNGLQENYIRQYWDMGYRITSLAYGASGWFVVMSTASGYTGQSYNHVKDWPSLWIDEMWGKGYRLTDFAYGNGMWTVVMSQGTSIDSQKWETCRVGDLKEKTTGWWDMGYHISGVACTGPDSWLVSVSDNMPYSAQAWTVCDSIESAKETIYEYWEQGYNLSALVYGDNRYFILVSKHVSGTNPKQWYIIDNKTPLDQIKVQWDENLRITCAGGGTDYLDANDDTGYTAPRNSNFLPGFGEKIMLLTDLGRVPEPVFGMARQCGHIIVESNYDFDMLLSGPYTRELKARIMGDNGHLSNDDCASFVKRVYHEGLKHVFLCHLSDHNNTPKTAYECTKAALAEIGVVPGRDLMLYPLPRREASEVIEL